MWSLKFLSGPLAGKETLLSEGLVLLGRDKSCQISIPSSGISKRHAQILIKKSGLLIEDMGSSNGVFFKGRQIQRQKLKEGDRVVLSDVVFEVMKKPAPLPVQQGYGEHYPVSASPLPSAASPKPSLEEESLVDAKGSLVDNIQKVSKAYISNVILPGVYKLAEWMDFRFVIGAFIIAFVILTAVLSSVPLISILKSSVEQESFDSAENIADTLSQINREVLKKGLGNALTVDYALKRPKVQKALIISHVDGRVLAPPELAHSYPKDPFIHQARKQNRTSVKKTGKSSVTALVPISFYNPETGESAPHAYSVVVYNTGSFASGAKKAVNLLIQTTLIAVLLGLALYFFLINLIEFPLRGLNQQLGQALKDDQASSVSTNYQSAVLLELCSHINSALNSLSLNKMMSEKDSDEEGGEGEAHRQNEMNNLVEITGFPSLSVDLEEESIASLNSNFTEQLGFSEILHRPLSEISDSVLRDHLLDLLERGKAQPQEITFGELSLRQMSLQSSCQFVMGKKDPAFALVTFMPVTEEGEAA